MTDYTSVLAGTSIARDYIIVEFLSKGSYGEVYKIRRILDDKLFALKVFRKCEDPSPSEINSEKLFRREADILRVARNVHVVSYEAFLESSCSIFIIMEFCAGGDLLQYLNKVKEFTGKSLPESDCVTVVTALLKALKVLHHDQSIIHRDIKPANILVRKPIMNGDSICLKPEDICLADFGLSAIFDSPFTSKASKKCGTESFNAPEQLLGEAYDMVSLELITSRLISSPWP
jgi:serine/threonine protein kinase